jgi:hypothetical protein
MAVLRPIGRSTRQFAEPLVMSSEVETSHPIFFRGVVRDSSAALGMTEKFNRSGGLQPAS